MSTSSDQIDSPRLRQRPYSEPNIDEKSLNLSGGLRPELVDVWSQRCAFVVDEILQTERDYVDSLTDVIEGYRGPLVSRLKSSSDTQKVVNTLFGNIDDLHGLHMSLLRKLRAHDTEPHEFGQVFIQTEAGFQLYTCYCTNYNSAMLCLQQLLMSEKHNQFLDQCQQNLRHTLPLSAQLIKPVQRITRYHLLLHDLVKHFNPNHYGYANLKQAHKAMARIADHINKVKKQEENAKRVEHLQTSLYGWKGNEGQDSLSVYGELLLESACHVGTKKGTERQVLLFEKLLLILKKKDTKRYNYKAHIVANELGLDDTLSSTNRTCFKIYSKARRHITYTIDPRSTSKRAEWVKTINDLIKRMPQDFEDEYERFVKRKKMEQVMSGDRRPVVPQRIESPGRVLSEKTNIGLHGRVPTQRKRKRGDVRDLFGQDKDVKLVNVRRAVTDETTYQVPQPQQQQLEPLPAMESEPVSEESMEQTPAAIPLGKRAESMESLLSLSDVEVGVEEHAGDFDDIDYHRRKIKRRNTDLKRRQAIKVKRSPSNQSLNASIRTRIRRKAREAKKDVEGEHQLTSERKESVSEDETELAKLMGPLDSAHPMDSSIDQDSLFSSSMDSSTLGQSVGGGGAVGVAEVNVSTQDAAKLGDFPSGGDTTAKSEYKSYADTNVALATEEGAVVDSVFDSGVHSDGLSLSSLRKISTGPPVEIIHNYRGGGLDNGAKHETIEEDTVFAKVIEDAGIGDSPIPDTVAVLMEDDKGGDILIVEDSSTDSEDEEEEDEGMGLSCSVEFDDGLSPVDTIPPPPAFAGDQEVPNRETDIEQQQEWDSSELDKSFHTQEQLSDFFTNLSREATPDLENADVSTAGQSQPPPSSSEHLPLPQETIPYRFQGDKGNQGVSPAIERVKDAEIYATMPRKMSRSKAGSPATTSPCVTPIGQQASKTQFSSSAQTHSRSAARRAEGFSELLQFTRQQQFTSPLGDMDVSQSLPCFTNGSVLQEENATPLVYNLTEASVNAGSHGEEAVGSDSLVPEPSAREERKSNEKEEETENVVLAAPEFTISPLPGHCDEKKETERNIDPSLPERSEVEIIEVTENGLHDSKGVSQESSMLDQEMDNLMKCKDIVPPDSVCIGGPEEEVKSETVMHDSEETNELIAAPEFTHSPSSDDGDEERIGLTKLEDISPSRRDRLQEERNDNEGESDLREKEATITSVTEITQEVTEPVLCDLEEGVNVLLAAPEFANPPPQKHSDDSKNMTNDEIISPSSKSAEVNDEEIKDLMIDEDVSRQTIVLDEVNSSMESTVSGVKEDQSGKIIVTSTNDKVSDKTERNEIQQNSSYHLRHRASEHHHEEQTKSPVVADTASMDSSREEREDSEERSMDSHSSLEQSVLLASQSGVFGWFRRIFMMRRGLFGFMPSLGFRGGLLVAGVAAISSVVIYNFSGYGHRGSVGVGHD